MRLAAAKVTAARLARAAAAVAAVCVLTTPLRAQEQYPSSAAITIVTPAGAGHHHRHLLARALWRERLSRRFGQQVIVLQTAPGCMRRLIAAQAVATAPADGCTTLLQLVDQRAMPSWER